MNWEAAGAIGEIIGALAVVISIVYLSTQIRSNTRATKASAGFEAAHSWATTNEWVVDLDPKFKARAVESYRPDANWNEFTPEERTDISLMHRSLFQKLEGQYYLLKYGYLDEGIWKSRSKWAASLVSLPFYREWWIQEQQQHIYSDEFVKVIGSIDVFEMKAAGIEDADT